MFVVLFPYFQAVLGWSATRSIAGLVPMIAVMMLASALAPKAAEALGAQVTILIGVDTAAAGLALMAALVSVDGGYLSVLPGMTVIGLGMGLTTTPSTEAITSSLPAERQGIASALNDVTREAGGALGIALLGAVLDAGYRGAIAPALASVPDGVADEAAKGIGRAFAAAEQTDAEQANSVIRAAQTAFVHGWANSMWVGAIGMTVLFVWLLLRSPRRERPAEVADAVDDAAVLPETPAVATSVANVES